MPLTATLTYSISFFGLSIKHLTILENTGTRVLVHFILSVGPCALEVILWPMRDIYKAGKPKCSQVFCTKWQVQDLIVKNSYTCSSKDVRPQACFYQHLCLLDLLHFLKNQISVVFPFRFPRVIEARCPRI